MLNCESCFLRERNNKLTVNRYDIFYPNLPFCNLMGRKCKPMSTQSVGGATTTDREVKLKSRT